MINKNNYHFIYRLSKRTVPFLKKENRFTKVIQKDKIDNLANEYIKTRILSEKPSMIARFGATESSAIANYDLKQKNLNGFSAVSKHLTGKINIFWSEDEKYLSDMMTLSGFFPGEEKELKKFVDLMKDSTQDLDALGVWNGFEEYLDVPEKTHLFKLRELEPWFFEEPWTYALKGKKVLIINYFADSINAQYKNRKTLYKNEKILPEFELTTIKSIMTISGEKPEFNTWFDALQHMKNQIDNLDFDVAIIGCAAYGFPLTSYIKKKGKIAIHLGGVTQLLFGIKGSRWENWQNYKDVRKNEGKDWIFAKEIPTNFKKIEDGCYW